VGITFGGLGGRVWGILHQRVVGGRRIRPGGGRGLVGGLRNLGEGGGTVRGPREVFLDMVGKRAMEKVKKRKEKREK
jgi:hypothetical protein